MERWVERWIGVLRVIMPLFNLVNVWVGVGWTVHKALSCYFWEFQLSGEARSRESWLLANKRGSLRDLCDRWQGRLEKTGCWWSGQLCLTVACCFSALSFASSSCFCKAAWRDFISSLSSEREVRNTLLAHLPALSAIVWLSSLYYLNICWKKQQQKKKNIDIFTSFILY